MENARLPLGLGRTDKGTNGIADHVADSNGFRFSGTHA
jgi:hypothetical protein